MSLKHSARKSRQSSVKQQHIWIPFITVDIKIPTNKRQKSKETTRWKHEQIVCSIVCCILLCICIGQSVHLSSPRAKIPDLSFIMPRFSSGNLYPSVQLTGNPHQQRLILFPVINPKNSDSSFLEALTRFPQCFLVHISLEISNNVPNPMLDCSRHTFNSDPNAVGIY
jgi:hypothetical protein